MTHDEQLDHYVLPNYGRYNLWPVRGEGARVWDRGGKEYLDCSSGVSVCPIGHCHPAVVSAITEQAKTLIHVSNWYCIDKQAELAEMLTEHVVRIPGKNFFSNSGAEANEGLLKLARRYAVQVRGIAKPRIVTFTGSFHGRTMGAMFATAQQKIWGDFGFTPDELGYLHRPFNDIAALKQTFADHDDIAAILVEPIQGESGVNAVTPEFLRAAQQLCREHKALLLLDEVQCSFGRAGEMCGWRSIIPGDEIQPDGISWAKAIGSGYPLGAFWVRDVAMTGTDAKLCDLLGPGSHGTTYGGSPLACAVGLATLHTIFKEDLCAQAKELGSHIAGSVRDWRHPLIKEVRQHGLFIGFQLDHEAIEAKTIGKVASMFLARKLLDAGLMTVPAGPHVLRWLPPLTLTVAEAGKALAIQKTVLDALL
ncbi:MAG: aspartate aminotransferase family protein [Verrucomicrobiaceae bacterium]